ncbi:hypothetical protein Tco_0770474 [Tanacetum coccineum]|uniref:RNA-directed DNA polymerase, eukaryota n=1 Tax=Tanacetum coccineum TaxID=301880 RepID=A0ABQ4ZCC5_9ASTR
MAGHSSKKWLPEMTRLEEYGSSNSNDGLAALVNKLDNLGRDMKKMKESVHAIRVGCQFCKGPHIDKDLSLQRRKLKTVLKRWKWDLESSGDFSVASVRKIIDDKSLSDVDSKTRWIKYVPIKVNVHAWKVKTDSLPTF